MSPVGALESPSTDSLNDQIINRYLPTFVAGAPIKKLLPGDNDIKQVWILCWQWLLSNSIPCAVSPQ